MNRILRTLWFVLFVRPLVLLALGLNVRNHKALLQPGPAIIVANHNSHLDTLVLMTLFPSRFLSLLRPVAAADYFLKNRWLAWFALEVVRIIPVERGGGRSRDELLAGCVEALSRGEILLLFPEGTRGEPEELAAFKSGVAHLAGRFPEVPVVPVFMHGLGKTLPRGEWVPVPFTCDVAVGEALRWTGDRTSFMEELQARVTALGSDLARVPWE